MNYLNVGANPKTIKGDILGEYLTGILYLAPEKTSGYQVCPSSTPGCRASCLFTAGRGKMRNVEAARIRKTRELFESPDAFLNDLNRDINSLINKAKRLGVAPCIRLNGTSDVYWPSKFPSLFTDYPDVIYYNYTKEEKIMRKFMDGKCPPNYYLTFSRSELNWSFCETVLKNNFTVEVVSTLSCPDTYKGYDVFNADETDLRFLDPPGQIGWLTAKGKAKKDTTGFVIREIL